MHKIPKKKKKIFIQFQFQFEKLQKILIPKTQNSELKIIFKIRNFRIKISETQIFHFNF